MYYTLDMFDLQAYCYCAI